MLLDRIRVTAISHLRVTASWSGTSPRSETGSAVYNPPPGYVVLSTETHVHSSSNGGGEVSVLAGGLNLVTESDVNEVYDAAIDLAASRNDDNLKLRLEEKKAQHIRELRRYQTSHNTVMAVVRARAHGSVVDRKRGWHEISVVADLIDLGGNSKPDLAGRVEQEFGIDIPGM